MAKTFVPIDKKPRILPADDSRHRRIVSDCARWLARKIETEGYVSHEAAVEAVETMSFPNYNECCFRQRILLKGSARALGHKRHATRWRFEPDVLKALRRLTGSRIVWERDSNGWHVRKKLG